MLFIAIGVILIFVFQTNKIIDAKKFIYDVEPYFRFMMESDYKFLLTVKYKGDIDVEKLYQQRVRNGIVGILCMILIFLSNLTFVNILISFIVGFALFKMPYMQLKNYYKANLHYINLMLPYYLKSLEILIQHYTVPIALSKSIETAPDVFKPGLVRLISKIESGDQTVDPYMDFAKEYPVRDSMRMMRLLYRLGLGSQESKQEQLMMFSRTISSLQNKAREQKYKERLEKMENKTMMMLMCTGGGILFLLMVSMMMMMNI
ncbi:MAG TPA: hypothetical protein GX747_03880 [Tenericutes bacterium]|nr:hypothetical protein [Mycoplasmatota bacterium]